MKKENKLKQRPAKSTLKKLANQWLHKALCPATLRD
jgi:hypothetical protein